MIFFADCSSYNEDTDACRSFGISEVLQNVARGFQNVANTLHVATANGIPKEQKNNLRSPELISCIIFYLQELISHICIYIYIKLQKCTKPCGLLRFVISRA